MNFPKLPILEFIIGFSIVIVIISGTIGYLIGAN